MGLTQEGKETFNGPPELLQPERLNEAEAF